MLRLNAVSLFFLSVFMMSCQSDTAQVNTCFNDFKTAVLERNGTKAAHVTDKATMDVFTEVINDVRTMDSIALQSVNASRRFLVLKIRHMIPREQIHDMGGKELIIALVRRGMSSNGGIRDHTLGKITFYGDSAVAERIDENRKTPFKYGFVKEKSSWKIKNLGSGFGSILIDELALNEGMSDNEYIFKLLEQLSTRKPSNEIWQPIR